MSSLTLWQQCPRRPTAKKFDVVWRLDRHHRGTDIRVDEKLLDHRGPTCCRHQHANGDLHYPLHTLDHGDHDLHECLQHDPAPINCNLTLYDFYADDHGTTNAGNSDLNVDVHKITHHQSVLENHHHDHHHRQL